MWGSTEVRSGQVWPMGHQLVVACLEGLEVKDPWYYVSFLPCTLPYFCYILRVVWTC